MSRRIHKDLDVRIRRAWPIDGDTTSSPPSAQRIRTRIDERIMAGAEPDASHTAAPARQTPVPRGRRRLAIVVTGAVVVSVLVVSGLVAGRLQPREQPDPVEFADQTATDVPDEPTARVPDDPDAHVETAIAATRRELDDLIVTKVQRSWINHANRTFPDVDAFTEQTTPHVQSWSVEAANGEWAFSDKWDIPVESVRQRSRAGCSNFADCSEPVGAMRFVSDQYYEREYGARAWERVIAEGQRGPSEVLRDGIALESTGFLTRRALLAVFEDYGGGWTKAPGGEVRRIRYRSADADEARRLILGLSHGKVLPRADFGDPQFAFAAPAVNTVEVWIDGASGLVHRVRTDQRSTRNITEDTTLLRQDIRFTYEGMSAVTEPEQAINVTFDEWCARERNARWCG
jgi:hypothetical protein